MADAASRGVDVSGKTVGLGRITPIRLTGDESFRDADVSAPFNVLDFWRWSGSDLVSNTMRGVLAEYIVGKALGCRMDVREEWAAYDLITPEGMRVEVKSSAYVQSWSQQRLSTVSFACPKRRGWDADTGMQDETLARHSDVYVFALLAHQDQPTIDPLDLSQWGFYAVPTAWLDARKRSQHSITLPSLRRDFGALAFAELRGAVAEALAAHRLMAGRCDSGA